MNGPEEAFGIYSVSRYRCKSIPPLSPFACQTKYQLQLCSGPFYISIINSTGNTKDSSTSLKIGEAIVRKIKDKPVDITSYLPGVSPEIINRGAILAKGELGIINGAADLIDYFGDATGYCAVIIHYEDQTMLSVRFFTKEDMNAFAILHHWDPEMLLTGSGKMPTGETISKISDNHLLITIKDEMASGS
jgi:hypothetical protein